MSEIDSIIHSFVCSIGFNNIYPLYHIEENAGKQFYGCMKGDLVLGGGGGERPAIRILKPSDMVLIWIEEVLERLESAKAIDEDTLTSLGEIISSEQYQLGCDFYSYWTDYLASMYTLTEPNLNSVEDFIKFIRDNTSSTQISLDNQFCAMIGEAIYYVGGRSWVKESVLDVVEQIKLMLPKGILHPIYQNAHIPPPGYPMHFGRSESGFGNFYHVWQ